MEIYKGNEAVFETFYNRKFMFVCYAFRETEKVITFLTDKSIFYIEKVITEKNTTIEKGTCSFFLSSNYFFIIWNYIFLLFTSRSDQCCSVPTLSESAGKNLTGLWVRASSQQLVWQTVYRSQQTNK